jgi:large subunit ribosomal protein L18e
MKNNQLTSLITELKKTSIKEDVKIWKRIASDLEKPTKSRRIVNLSRINRYVKNGEIIVVPGKVLSMGELDKKVTVAAYNFSGNAKDKIKQSGSSVITILDLIKTNPKGKKVRIIG